MSYAILLELFVYALKATLKAPDVIKSSRNNTIPSKATCPALDILAVKRISILHQYREYEKLLPGR